MEALYGIARETEAQRLSHLMKVTQPGKWQGWGSNQARDLTPLKPHTPLSKVWGGGCLCPVE